MVRLIALSATTALVVSNTIVEIRIHEETAPAKRKEPHINSVIHVWKPDGERSPLVLKPSCFTRSFYRCCCYPTMSGIAD